MDDEPFDPIPGIIAAVDQLKKAAPLQAEGMWAIYEAFTGAGFDEDQAFQIVLFFLGNTMFNDVDQENQEE